MKKLFFAIIVVVVVTNSLVLGALIEASIEVDPVVSHNYYYDEEHEVGNIEASVSPIVLPEVTLAPGDTFRVNVNFTGGKFLKVINGADLVGIELNYRTGSSGSISSPKTSDALAGLDITRYHNVLNTIQSSVPWCNYYESPDEYRFGKQFCFDRDEGVITDGSLFGDFTVEFTAPTEVGAEPFSTNSYIFNSVVINAFLSDTTVDKNILEVVPEPATILLLGLGGISLILRKRSRE
jgi:hypothetical protein